MASLTPSDVKRWDLGAIHQVFETASNRANTLQRLGDNLGQVHTLLSDWQGEAGDAFRVDLGKTRGDIEADGQESTQVAAAVSRAEADVRGCKAELDDIERAADANGWAITSDWRIDLGDTAIGRDPVEFAAEQQLLQDQLNACKVHAHAADHELAAAVRGAVGEVPLDASGHPPGDAYTAQGGPRSLQDMLLPAGPADVGPGGSSPGAPNTAGGIGGKPPSLQDLLLPTGKSPASGEGAPEPEGLPGLLSQPGVLTAPPPRLDSAELERAKPVLRQAMIDAGVPADQIEARLNEYAANAQQWLENGGPHYVPPEAPAPPPPGFAEGFGDRWFATKQGIKNLIGQGGPGAPGVAESWESMLKGTTEITQNPIGAAVGEFQNALDSPSPAYYLGEKASDGAFALPGVMFGGEGVGLGELTDAPAFDYGATNLSHVPIGLDQPTLYHPWAAAAGQDLYSSFMHGEPTADLSQQFADMSTHYVAENPDRVVLGKSEGQDDGYIGDARGNGGIYYDTGNDAWNALTEGLTGSERMDLGWQANEHFLRDQMESGVSRIEYVLDGQYSSLEEVFLKRQGSFSAKEIEFLTDNASTYGYQRVGNAWVKE